MTEKLSKDEVNYSRGHVHSHCGRCWTDDNYHCKHFISNSTTIRSEGRCEIVAGSINPIYWCDRWKRAT